MENKNYEEAIESLKEREVMLTELCERECEEVVLLGRYREQWELQREAEKKLQKQSKSKVNYKSS